MTSYVMPVTGQNKPLTLIETKQLLRESLDREAILVQQRDAALAHIKSLDKEISDAKSATAVDKERINNLVQQRDEAKVEVKEIRAALQEERDAATKLRSALDRAEKEVQRQKDKVAAANRRTVYVGLAGVIVGIIAAIFASK
jgi:chromosome segregation ATPase